MSVQTEFEGDRISLRMNKLGAGDQGAFKAIRWLLAVALVCAASCNGERNYRDADYSRNPVVFVHGSGLSTESWGPLLGALRSAGYPSSYLYAVAVEGHLDNVDIAGRQIRRAVDAALRHATRRATASGVPVPVRVDFVGHSMGAFSTRYFAALLEPERVRVWIGIAGANHGSDALCGAAESFARDLCPSFAANAMANPAQVALNGTAAHPKDVSPYGLGSDQGPADSIVPTTERCLAYYTVRIEPDEWIKPEASAMLSGAGGFSVSSEGLSMEETSSGNYLFAGESSHDDLPKHPQLIGAVIRILSAADHQWAKRCGQGTGGDTEQGNAENQR